MAITELAKMAAAFENVQDALTQKTRPKRIKFTSEFVGIAADDLAANMSDALRRVAREFMELYVRKRIVSEFNARMNYAHYPLFTGSKTASKEYAAEYAKQKLREGHQLKSEQGKQINPEISKTQQGWNALLGALATQPKLYNRQEFTIGYGIGDMGQILSLDSRDYSPLNTGRSKSPLTNWFLTVEFGTGIAENVGGQQYVRLEGDTKDLSGDGSWWTGGQGFMDKINQKKEQEGASAGEPASQRETRAGTGLHFFGQKGFNIFFDPGDRWTLVRKHNPMWDKIFYEELPKYLFG